MSIQCANSQVRDMTGYGRIWQDMVGYGRIWQDMVGLSIQLGSSVGLARVAVRHACMLLF